jgi:UDP-2-acetamido-2-deoxy-ribo-hexuluronate aminotransferase
MNFIDLKTQYALIEENVNQRIKQVLDHGQYVMGPEVAELEEQLAEFVGVRHCVGVSSGTDALLVAMMALGIGRGDEVITTPFTFIATGEMIALLGATPVFVDIEADTYNIDPRKIEAAITPRTKAIMPVSLYGQCADFDSINALARRHGIPVIEDAAQSLGATYKGRASCSLSEIGCTSFFPSKPLGGYGDSGACFTDDDELAQRMRELRNHGQSDRYYHPVIGLNARLDTLQAAVLLAKLEIFPGEVEARQRIGARYSEMIRERGLALTTPAIREGNTSVYAQYTLASDNRAALLEQLQSEGIPTAVHYPRPLHRQPALATDAFDLKIADRLSEKVFSLPMHPYLSEADQERIVDTLAIRQDP